MPSIESQVFDVIAAIAKDRNVAIDASTPLIGENRLFDSMNLVELCLQLEDLATRQGFEFDWISDAAMSRSASMFRTAGSLATEFSRQISRQMNQRP